jgi:hypothetical protein
LGRARNAFAFPDSCCSGLWVKRFMGIICFSFLV